MNTARNACARSKRTTQLSESRCGAAPHGARYSVFRQPCSRPKWSIDRQVYDLALCSPRPIISSLSHSDPPEPILPPPHPTSHLLPPTSLLSPLPRSTSHPFLPASHLKPIPSLSTSSILRSPLLSFCSRNSLDKEILPYALDPLRECLLCEDFHHPLPPHVFIHTGTRIYSCRQTFTRIHSHHLRIHHKLWYTLIPYTSTPHTGTRCTHATFSYHQNALHLHYVYIHSYHLLICSYLQKHPPGKNRS